MSGGRVNNPKNKKIMAAKKIISDMVLPQKKEITAQLFREPPPTIKHPSPQKNRRWGRDTYSDAS